MTENVKKLSEKDKVRKKISVWLGASNHIAVIHTVKELVGNSADEINKGNGNKIEITMHDEKTLTIKDNCQGLPIEGKSEDGTENYKLLFETLFAGTKYDNGIDNEDYTVGTNGVFNTVLAFSSAKATFRVARPNGKVYLAEYVKGENEKGLQEVGKSEETFTEITYTLDDDIFDENYFTFEELKDIASEQASLIDGEIHVTNVNGDTEVFEYPNGTKGLLEETIDDMNLVHPIISFSKEKEVETKIGGNDVIDKIKAVVNVAYSKTDDNVQIEFLNGSNLIHHGTIYDGLISGLKTVIHKFLKDNGHYNKNEKQISKDDIITGLNYVINFKSYFPVFANQTKFASYVKYYEEVMKEIIESHFEIFGIENKSDMELIAKQVLVNKRSREKAEKTRLDVKKKLSGTVNNLTNRVEGFVNCKSKNNDETELYIVEGKSALGSTKQGRDQNTQAIYALRGKILNCLKADYTRIFKNETIVDLLKIFGCGVEVGSKNKDISNFDFNKLKWDKIIITTDADVDGMHIRTLVITMLYVLTPTLIKEGKVYIAESPLYEITNNDDTYFAYSDSERDKIVKKLKGQTDIQRSKGLGENTAEMMWETTMNPESRRLIQINPEDIEEAKEYFEMFLGDNIEGRKEFITDNLHKYIDEALEE